MRFSRNHLLATGAVICVAAAPAQAQARSFNVPAQPAETAITELGRQADIQIIAARKVTSGKQVNGVQGSMTVDQALSIMLDGTDLNARQTGPQTYTVVPKRKISASSVNAQALASIGTLSLAQSVEPAPRASSDARQVDASAGAEGAEDRAAQGGLEDIIVTAQRRSERLQDVPISVAAINGPQAEARGITSTADMTAAVPGLTVSQEAGVNFFLRGVGTTASGQETVPSVALYVDDVYIAAVTSTLFNLDNVERVEVLKGPQGTLFGRNATAGVIQIVTPDPSHTTQFDAKLGYGNYETFTGSVYATTGLTDDLAFNFSAYTNYQERGFGKNLFDGSDLYYNREYGARAKLLWTPTDTTRIRLSADYSHDRTTLGFNYRLVPGAVTIAGRTSTPEYTVTNEKTDITRLKSYGFSARVDQDLGFASLVSISALRRNTSNVVFNLSGDTPTLISINSTTPHKTFSQEFQLVSPKGGQINWILGLYYFHGKVGYAPLDVYGPLLLPNLFLNRRVAFQNTDSVAAFGQASAEIFPDTNLTLGMRYTSDRFKVDGSTTISGGLLPGPLQVLALSQKSKDSAPTWRISLDHKFGPNILAYASYNRGFKSGGFGLVAYNQPAVKPEVLDAYEIGLKSQLFDNLLTLNMAAFYYDFRDLQVAVVLGGDQFNVNAGKAKIKGIEADATVRLSDNFTLNGNISLLDHKYTSFPEGILNLPNPAICPTPGNPGGLLPGPRTGGNLQCLSVELAGNKLARAPDTAGSISATYRLPTDVGTFTATATGSYTGEYFWSPDNRLQQPSYWLLNANIGWTSPSGQFEAQLWAKNLTNKYYRVYSQATAFLDYETPAAPRTYGVRLGVHF